MADAPHGLATRRADGTTVFQALRSVEVHATIVDTSAHVVVTQTFHNINQTTAGSDARYIFPTPANAAVCAFQMQTSGGRVIRARVKELAKAQEEFEAALAEDKWAGLLQEVTADAFIMSVGAIPAGQDVTITISYAQELPQDDLVNQVRFTFPTHVAERYGTLPTALRGPTSATEHARLAISVDANMASTIERVHSPTHNIKRISPAAELTGSLQARVELDSTVPVTLLRDFVLSIQAEDVSKPRCVAEIDAARQSVALSLTLVPNLGLSVIPEQEYVFILDRSGSMQEDDRIDFAKAALQVFLRSLPAQSTLFNVVSFGQQSVPMWPASRRYDPATLDYATVRVDAMAADMGGTEIQLALQDAIFSRSRAIPTSVFVLTDGKVWHTNRVLEFVRGQVAAASSTAPIRVFTLGVGDGASTELCEGLARVGNGICFMTSSSEDIAGRCAALLKAARVSPSGNVQGLTVDWGSMSSTPAPPVGSFYATALGSAADASRVVLPPPPAVQQAPSKVPDMYPDNRFVVSAILSRTLAVPAQVTIRGRTPDGREARMSFPVQNILQHDNSCQHPRVLHLLAARRLITELEDGVLSSLRVQSSLNDAVLQEHLVKAAVVRLSEEYQLASRFAAFVAVDDGKAVPDSGDPVDDDSDDDSSDDASEASYRTAESSPQDTETVELAHGTSLPSTSQHSESKHATAAPPAAPPPPAEASPPVTYAVVPSRRRTALDNVVLFVANSIVHYVPPLEDFIEIFALSSGPARPVSLAQIFRRAPSRHSPPRRMVQHAPRGAPLRDAVTGVARLQAHDGSFSLSPALGAFISGGTGSQSFVEDCRSAKPRDVDDTVWGTAIVLAFLRVKQAAQRSVWENLWLKALEYASQHCQGGRSAFVQLIDQAEALL